jgi:RimJ/RimL family protein N-acetyltransferase
MELSSSRLLLRRWRAEDREPFARLNADPRVMEFFPAPLSREESDRKIDLFEQQFEQHGFGMWAVERRGHPGCIGCIGLLLVTFPAPFTPAVEVGWQLAASEWGRGLATEGAREALRYGFETLALQELVSFTVPANRRSRAVMEKLGFRHDPADDFDHPRLPPDHPFRRHVLYRLLRADWLRPGPTRAEPPGHAAKIGAAPNQRHPGGGSDR